MMKNSGAFVNIIKLVNNPCYILFWKYKIKPGKLDEFEFEYGSNGSWQKLFNKSKFYQGSFLIKKVSVSDTYYLLDVWNEQLPYEKFLKKHQSAYHQLSDTLEKLYVAEEKIGIYHDILQLISHWRKEFDKCSIIGSVASAGEESKKIPSN